MKPLPGSIIKRFQMKWNLAEVSDRYISEALKDPDSRLYILLKDGQAVGVCTVDVSGTSNYLYGLAVVEDYRGKGYGATWQNPLSTNSLSKMTRPFRLPWKTAM